MGEEEEESGWGINPELYTETCRLDWRFLFTKAACLLKREEKPHQRDADLTDHYGPSIDPSNSLKVNMQGSRIQPTVSVVVKERIYQEGP